MTKILLIETSTALTSVALAYGEEIVFYKDDAGARRQAALTAPFIKEALDSQGLKASGLDAVCVGMGPGSYTGLRVGVSSAKGLCFGAGVPLLAVGTLDILASQALSSLSGGAPSGRAFPLCEESSAEAVSPSLPEGLHRIVPVLDARRMEVYTAEYSPEGRRLTDVHAQVVEAGTFDALLSEGPVLFVGDAAPKCEAVIRHPNAHFLTALPSARGMLRPALAEFSAGNWRDTAYFEPFYLKDFVATVSRKKLF